MEGSMGTFVIWRITGNNRDTEKLIQLTFFRIFKNIDLYKPEKGTLYTWMVRIAQNQAYDLLRKSTRYQQTFYHDNEGMAAYVAGQDIPVEHIGLRALVETLKSEEQMVIRMQFLEGYTQPEIAEKLNMPLGTVKTRSRNGLIRLRTYFKSAA
jgi:RNA polymerase sigma-70 factor, ECF subfamily